MRSGLQRIDPGRCSLGDYSELAGEEQIERIRALSESLRGMRVIHVSPAAPRNGCPEMLRALLPLAADAGLDVEWRVLSGAPPFGAGGPAAALDVEWGVLYGSPPFGDVARDLYDGMQGAETAIAPSTWSEFLDGATA